MKLEDLGWFPAAACCVIILLVTFILTVSFSMSGAIRWVRLRLQFLRKLVRRTHNQLRKTRADRVRQAFETLTWLGLLQKTTNGYQLAQRSRSLA